MGSKAQTTLEGPADRLREGGWIYFQVVYLASDVSLTN